MRRFADQRSRQRQSLTLPARKPGAAFRHQRLQVHRHVGNIAVDAGQPRRFQHIVEGSFSLAEGDVLADRAAKEKDLLRDDAHLPAQRPAIQRIGRCAAKAHGALRRLVQAQQQPRQRALARAGAAHDGDLLARFNLHVDPLQHRRTVAVILERDIVQGYLASHPRRLVTMRLRARLPARRPCGSGVRPWTVTAARWKPSAASGARKPAASAFNASIVPRLSVPASTCCTPSSSRISGVAVCNPSSSVSKSAASRCLSTVTASARPCSPAPAVAAPVPRRPWP